MRIQVLTIFPELFETFLHTSLIGRAIERGLFEVRVEDLRDHTRNRHRSVDDEPYGGGGGMVMTAPPWIRAVRALGEGTWRVLLSPQGERLTDAKVRELAAKGSLLLLCGRYEGIDERVRQCVVDEEISIGDYVLSGGEVPAMVVIEALSRQVPGVVQLAESVERDSFRLAAEDPGSGTLPGLLDYPNYTRPREVEGLAVPDVLLSGNHAEIEAWRQRQALAATLRKRPDLLRARAWTRDELRELARLADELGEKLPAGLQPRA